MGVREVVMVAVMVADNLVVAIEEGTKVVVKVKTVAEGIWVVAAVEAVVQTVAM